MYDGFGIRIEEYTYKLYKGTYKYYEKYYYTLGTMHYILIIRVITYFNINLTL